ncbi:transposase, partial [Shigella flexneri]
STLKSPSYTKSVSWQHYLFIGVKMNIDLNNEFKFFVFIMNDI